MPRTQPDCACPRRGESHPGRWIRGSLLAALLAGAAGLAPAAGYEPGTVQFNADQLLDAALRKGPYHTVNDTVVNQGYLNHYRIATPFGEFMVSGNAQLPGMVQEINAIATLQQMSKTGVLAESASKVVQKPVETVKNVAADPETTIKGIPAGVGRLFARAKDVAKDVSTKVSHASDGDGDGGSSTATVTQAGTDMAMHYLGVGSAQRDLARELEVDPYSENEVLQGELGEMAKYAAAGSFGTKLIMPSIPGMGMVSNVNDLVWKLSARDLKLRNQKSLGAMGIDEAGIQRFFDNPWYSPTDQTHVVVGLEALNGVDGQAIIVAKAAAAASRDEALLYGRLVAMLAAYHKSRAALARIFSTGRMLPLSVTRDGAALLAVPVDYINWRESTAGAAAAFIKAAAAHGHTGSGEIWIEGRASERARRELNKLGWSVFEQAFNRLGGPA